MTRIEVVQLPWGRLAVVVGDDSIFPETFRLAALQDADVVAVPLNVQEAWELETGLRERAAENRVNLVAASRPSVGGGGSYVVPLVDFGMWRKDRKERFDGVISCPEVVAIAPAPASRSSSCTRTRPRTAWSPRPPTSSTAARGTSSTRW